MSDDGPGFDARRRLAALEELARVQSDVIRRAARALEELDRRLALVERTAPPPAADPPVPTSRRCATCGGDLAGRRGHARYCSSRCRWRACRLHASRTLSRAPRADRSR